jgi:hypothetical protein
MVREPDATRQPTPHDNQLMSKHRVLSLKPQLRLEWRRQDGQNETEQPDHSASLGDSITASTQIRFSVHTAAAKAGLALDPSFTIRRYRHRVYSNNPTYLAKRERIYQCTRMAGLPES